MGSIRRYPMVSSELNKCLIACSKNASNIRKTLIPPNQCRAAACFSPVDGPFTGLYRMQPASIESSQVDLLQKVHFCTAE